MNHSKAKNTDPFFNRLVWSLAIVFLLSLALFFKLAYLQIIKASKFAALSDKQHEFSQEVLAPRGRILATSVDGQDWPLAMNRIFYEVYAVPKDLDQPAKEKLVLAMSQVFDVPISEASSSAYWFRIDKENDPYEMLQRKVEGPKLLELYALLTDRASSSLRIEAGKIKASDETVIFKGLGFENRTYRYYPESEAGAHILGFVNYENQGTYGLEGYFDKELSGEKGWLSGTRFSSRREKADPGQDLYLTIDKALQYKACQLLVESKEEYEFKRGTIIVANPENGDILAMCSYPSFDPNNYGDIDDQSLLHNPAIAFQYEPGSVMKVLTMAAAVDQGKVSPNTSYFDKGQVMINGWPKPISNADFYKYGGHGVTDMKTVLDMSLNTGAIFAMQETGANVFANYLEKFGLGRDTNIELPGEVKGDIRKLQKDKVKEIDAATASFGQGIAVTPIQMIMSYAAIANDGILMKPRLIRKRITDDGKVYENQPQEIGRVISEKSAKTILAMLVSVVENGHSKSAGVKGYYIGGKTGTAQIAAPGGGYLEDEYVHTFIGMGPVEDPKFVILVKMDSPEGIKFAESTAAPVFGQMADFLIKYYHLAKTR